MDKSIYICTLGCAKNEVDSKKMAERLKGAGYFISDSHKSANVIIINTCSFIESATSESIETVLDFLDIKKDFGKKIVIAGCMPSRYSKELEKQFLEVDAFLPCDEETNVVSVVEKLIGKPKVTTKQNVSAQKVVSSYVKISEGCNRACTFCTIPKIRGKYRSFSYEQIYFDVNECVNRGSVEINFVAQDTGHWGKDFKNPKTLAWLLNKISLDFPNTLFRVLYVQPDEVCDELLSSLAKNDNVIKYLDIPLQHASKHVLKDMNRSGDFETFKTLVEHIKKMVPNIVLRTTFLTGFPTETEEDFLELLDFASLGLFDYAGVFGYSDEEGTPSHEYKDKNDEEEIKYRVRELSDVIDTVCTSKIRELIGSNQKVIIEGKHDDGQLYGRCLFQAPEVDGVIYVDKGKKGEVVDVKITDSLMYDLEGEVR